MASQRETEERKVNFSSSMSTRETETGTEDDTGHAGRGTNTPTNNGPTVGGGEEEEEERGGGGGEENERGRGECGEEEDTSNDDEQETDVHRRWMPGILQDFLEGNEFVIDPEGEYVYRWMGLVACAVAYNVWMIVLRVAFHHHLTNQVSKSLNSIMTVLLPSRDFHEPNIMEAFQMRERCLLSRRFEELRFGLLRTANLG
ncbi:uncharacterized protein LOC115929614 [Strongylocentrotus purpuratus]|uniref:Uncharacterized protein n=1 Tax=Strongylocentrotus purpuratus TaxID=7668 RepID=A0A7M7PR28_STRPU|nr:uncharacterized protein LOC115929614 [Strongylocentrotus purpuratus]